MRRLAGFFALLILTTQGWADFTVPTDAEVLVTLEKTLAGKSEYFDSQVKRLGKTKKNTLEVDCTIALKGDLSLFKKIVSDYPDWREWLLADFNLPEPGASDYTFQFHDIVAKDASTIVTVFSFNLPFFGKHRSRAFNVTQASSSKSFSLLAETQLNETSVVKFAKGYLKTVQPSAPAQTLWIAVKAVVEFRNSFIYEVLPDKVVLREVGDRLKTISENYKREEVRLRSSAQRATSSAPIVLPNNND